MHKETKPDEIAELFPFIASMLLAVTAYTRRASFRETLSGVVDATLDLDQVKIKFYECKRRFLIKEFIGFR